MPNVSPPEHKDWNTWRGTIDTHLQGIKQSQEAIHTCLKKHIEQTDDKLQEVELEVATNKQKTVGEFKVVKTRFNTLHWLIRLIVAGLLGLAFFGLRTQAFGTERVFTRDSTGVTIRDRDKWEEHRFVTVLKGRDTITTYRINVENFLSYGFYIRCNGLGGADSTDLAVIYLQSDTTTASFFGRVEDHCIIDTSITEFTDTTEYRRWYPWYPAGLKYVKFRIYGNTDNDPTSGDSIDVRIYLNKMWKGTMRLIPGTGVYAHQHSYFDKPFDFYDNVTFWGKTSAGGAPYAALRWSPYSAYGRTFYPLTDDDVALGRTSKRFRALYSKKVYLSNTAWLIEGDAADEIGCSGDFVPTTDAAKNLGLSAGRWDTTFTVYAEIDTLTQTVVSNDATASVSAQPNSYPFNVVGYPTTGVYFERTSAKDGSGLPMDYRRKGGEFPDWRRDGLGTGLMGKIRFRGGGSNFFTVDVLGANKGDVTFYDKNSVKYMQWDASFKYLFLTSSQYAWLDASTASELTVFANNNLRLATDGVSGDITFNNDFVPTIDKAVDLGSRSNAIDTLYYDGIVDMSCVFEGTGEEALGILGTLEKDPQTEHSPNYGKLDPYLNANNAIHFDRLVYVLAAAVKELQAEIEELKSQK